METCRGLGWGWIRIDRRWGTDEMNCSQRRDTVDQHAVNDVPNYEKGKKGLMI